MGYKTCYVCGKPIGDRFYIVREYTPKSLKGYVLCSLSCMNALLISLKIRKKMGKESED